MSGTLTVQNTVTSPHPVRKASSLPFRPRLLYGSTFVWLSITGGRFLAPFLEHEAGMSPRQIGLTLALQQAMMTTASASGGAWADARERLFPGRGRTQIMALGLTVGTVIYLLHALPLLFANRLQHHSANHHITFYHMLLRCLYALALSLVTPVLDGITIAFLKKQQEQAVECVQSLKAPGLSSSSSTTTASVADFGKERLYGAIWWALTNVCLGPLLDQYGFVITFPLALITSTTALITIHVYVRALNHPDHGQQRHPSSQTPHTHGPPKDSSEIANKSETTGRHESFQDLDSDISPEGPIIPNNGVLEDTVMFNGEPKACDQSMENEPRRTLPLKQLLRLLLGTTYGSAFLVALLALASGQAVVDNLIFLFFETLNSSYTMMGLTVVLTVGFEIPIFHVAPQLLAWWQSGRLLLIAAACYVVRVLGYTLIPSGHMAYVLFLEPLHGITYACSQTAAVDFVARSMPLGYEASGQGLVYLFRGLGSVAGLFLGGLADERFGPRFMYRCSALIVFSGASFFATVACCFISSENVCQLDHQPLPQHEDDVELTIVRPDQNGVDRDKQPDRSLAPSHLHRA